MIDRKRSGEEVDNFGENHREVIDEKLTGIPFKSFCMATLWRCLRELCISITQNVSVYPARCVEVVLRSSSLDLDKNYLYVVT